MFPIRGRLDLLQSELWVDLSAEELYSHNQVRLAFTCTLGRLARATDEGLYCVAGMRWSDLAVALSVQPDALFIRYNSLRTGVVQLVATSDGDYDEITGTPDMVLEVVSASSVTRDTVRLRELYWRAGVPEYWLVDARGATPRFDALHRGAKRYVATRRQTGWTASAVFGRRFRLTRQADPLGQPRYVLSVQP
ncbi:MAG TPA: Uma2 family endonuclease [Gemmataceae bacterium]|nr:Uma2 family endonuclease [Gemmataceae bacterium]